MKHAVGLVLLGAFALTAGCSSSSKGGSDAAVTDAGLEVVDAPPETADASPEIADAGAGDTPVGVDATDAPDAGAPDAEAGTPDAEAGAPDAEAGAPDAEGDAPDDGGGGVCPHWTGDRQFGTAKDDTVLALAATAQGVVAGGYVGGTLHATNIEPSGDARGFVRALSTAGDIVWETAIDATGTETVEAIAVAATGDIAVAGRTTGAFSGFVNAGHYDAFAAWLSLGGALGAVRQFGDERPQHPRRVVITPSGLGIGGFDDEYVPTNYVVDWPNPFFATVAAPPATAVAFHPDRTLPPDFADGLALDPLGSGDFFLSTAVTSGAQRGLFVRRVGADGSPRWTSRFSSVSVDQPGPMIALADGTLWVSAAWVRTTGTSDVAVMHVNAATGALIESNDLPSEDGAEEVTAFTRDARGDFWLAGSVAGLAFRGATSQGEYDAFVFHLDQNGLLIDAWQGSTPGEDLARALAVDACGNVVIGGSTTGALVGGATPLGGADAFVLRVPLEVRR